MNLKEVRLEGMVVKTRNPKVETTHASLTLCVIGNRVNPQEFFKKIFEKCLTRITNCDTINT